MNIQTLILETSLLQQTTHFYAQILGFERLHQTENRVVFRVGSSTLTFKQALENIHPKYHFAFNIPLNQFNEAMVWAKQRLTLLEIEHGNPVAHFETWKAQSFYFYDNNQNILEFICRTDLNNNSNLAFSIHSIVNINEVGIVTDEPLILAQQIITQTQIEYFSKGPVRADFVALGDDKGLFVISNPLRNWYPTHNLAEKHKIEVTINLNNTEYMLEFNSI